MAAFPVDPPPPIGAEKAPFDLNLQHGHKDLVQAVAFNAYGDRCVTGSVDGRLRVFNRHRDGTWRLCDTWGAHGGEILEVQWLPPTIYPNLVASLGIEGRFKLWAEDPSAAPGRRFSSSSSSSASTSRSYTGGGRAAFETRSHHKAPYRSFSIKHLEDTRHTYLALLAADGRLAVFENDQPENLVEYTSVDDFAVCAKPSRGEETAFRVKWDPNPEPCYAALRAGIAQDSLALVAAGMTTVKLYRSREVMTSAIGVATVQKEFYLAAEIGVVVPGPSAGLGGGVGGAAAGGPGSGGHRGLVRDVAWAPGNIRGYDVIATACQDGFVRVFKVETPCEPADGKTWSTTDITRGPSRPSTAGGGGAAAAGEPSPFSRAGSSAAAALPSLQQHQSGLSASLAKSGSNGSDNHHRFGGGEQPGGQVPHVVTEISRLDSHRTPVWRVDFNDDGQILGSVGDDGKLMCYRQIPDGTWAKSSELAMMKTRMAAP